MYPVARRPSKLIALLPAADPPPTFENLEHNPSRACLPVTLRRNASGSRIRALLGSLARWGVYSSSTAQRSRCRQTGAAIPRARALAPGLRSRGRSGQFRSCCAGVCRGLRRVRSSPSAEEQQHRAGTDGCHAGPGGNIDGLFLLELDLCDSQIRFVGFPGVAEAPVDQAENAQDDQHDAENSEPAHRFSGLVIDADLLQRAKPCTLDAPPPTVQGRSRTGSFLVRLFPRCLPADHLPPAVALHECPVVAEVVRPVAGMLDKAEVEQGDVGGEGTDLHFFGREGGLRLAGLLVAYPR